MGILNNSKNGFLKKGVDINLLSDDYKEIIKQIQQKPSIGFTYICKKCKQIPKIEPELDLDDFNYINIKSEGYIGKINFRECKNSIILNEENIDSNDFNLEKVSLNKLKEDNYMNINQLQTNKNDNFLNFETLDNFYQYIEVYKSYLNIKKIIEDYNLHDTKNDKIFTLFENLLLLGFYGYGTKYEYENSIIIKQFSLDKFYMYVKEYSLRLRLLNINIIDIKKMDIHKVYGDENLYALIPYYRDNYKGIYILKYQSFLDKSFDIQKCIDYCYEIDSIPEENKKNILSREKGEYLLDIISLGEKRYLIRKEKREFALFNCRPDDSKAYTYCFDEPKNEYIIEKINLDKDIEIEKISLFKKNKVLIETIENLYLYEIINENNSLKFNLIKKFDIKSDEKYLDLRGEISLIEANNDDIIYYYPSKLLVISTINYQIKTTFKLNGFITLEQLNKNLIKIDDVFKMDLSALCLDMNKMSLVRINNLNGYYLDKNFWIKKEYNAIFIYDSKLKKIILSYQYDNNNLGYTKVFILNKKEKKFGIFFSYKNNENKFMIFQLKL